MWEEKTVEEFVSNYHFKYAFWFPKGFNLLKWFNRCTAELLQPGQETVFKVGSIAETAANRAKKCRMKSFQMGISTHN